METVDVNLIFMAIILPGMDGVEAMNAFRHMKNIRDLPILALSANVMEKDTLSTLGSELTDYIVKPLNIAEFLEKINKFLV